jgi:predicted DNA-binding transcriptional regulator YafY
MKRKLSKLSQKQKERLSFIDFCANFLGSIGRAEIVSRFGISDASASKDLSTYIDLVPKNLKYDFKSRTHLATKTFKPIYEFEATQVLRALSTGFGDTLEQIPSPFIYSETAVDLNNPNTSIIAQVSRGIKLNKIVQITYHSLSSGQTEREIAPFAVVNSGLRWHVRAFDRKTKSFRDFVFTRILTAKVTNKNVEDDEKSGNDTFWNEKITIELAPHPSNIKEKRSIEMDYGMRDGSVKVTLRKAVAGYVLRHWNVDSTENHQLDGKHFQLWLTNRDEIEGIEEVILAPGIDNLSGN